MTRARSRSSAFDRARSRADGRGARAAPPRTRRAVRRLHGRSRRTFAAAARGRGHAGPRVSIATRTRSSVPASRWRHGASAWRSCTPTTASSTSSLDARGLGADRRRAGRPRRVVAAIRRAGPRLQLSARRTARHAHGSDRAGKRPRQPWWRARRSASWPTSSFSTAKNASLGALRDASSRRAPEQPIDTTGRLAAIVRRARFLAAATSRIDPATRTFQALRIWVNQELEGLDTFLVDGDPPPARRRAPRRHHVSLARRPHRQAHAARAGAEPGRRGPGADEETDRAERRRSAGQSTRTEREAARRRAARVAVDGERYGAVRIRHQEGRSEQSDRPRSRSRTAARAVVVSRRRRRARRASCCSGPGSTSSCCATAIGSDRCSVNVPSEEENRRQLRLEFETLRAPRARRVAGDQQAAPRRPPPDSDAIVIERVLPAEPPAKTVVARR